MADDSADHSLWRRLLARDARAMETLIARYSREVAYFVRMVLDGVGTSQDVEECVSDLFVAAWQEAASFDPERGALRTWLMMRVKYLALDRRRQLQRRQAFAAPAQLHPWDGDEAGDRPSGEHAVDRVADEESLDGLVERRERQEQLRRALEGLTTLDRHLVYYRYFQLASTEEIAARTGLTRRAIDTRLWRARRTLRDALEAIEQGRPPQPSPPVTAPPRASRS